MPSFNKVILVGNLTRDPELRYTPKGTAVSKLTIACNRKWKTESGETKEEVAFIDIDSFGKQAETVSQFTKKGDPLMVEGRLKLDTWDDKQSGQKRSKLGVVMETFQFLSHSPAEPGPKPKSDKPSTNVKQKSDAPPESDDAPF